MVIPLVTVFLGAVGSADFCRIARSHSSVSVSYFCFAYDSTERSKEMKWDGEGKMRERARKKGGC